MILLDEDLETEDDTEEDMKNKAQMLMQITPAESHQSISGAEGGHGRGVGLVRTFLALIHI